MVENQEEIVAHVIVVPESCLHDARPFSSTCDPFHLLVEKYMQIFHRSDSRHKFFR